MRRRPPRSTLCPYTTLLRSLGGIRRALMGTVSDSVVRHAHCPVLVVRGEPVSFPAKIILATDGSKDAELAATTAADLAKSASRSEEHTSELQSRQYLVCRLL